jgi:hypothetical protein
MTKSTITREQLLEIIETDHVQCGEASYLARMALAAMDSEPVAVTDDELNAALQLHRLKVDGHSQLSDAFRAGFRYARRTAPQPAPVVPEDVRQAISIMDDEIIAELDAEESACRPT